MAAGNRRRRQIILNMLLGWGFLLWVWATRPVMTQAQSKTPSLETESNATYTYGQAVTFYLQAATDEGAEPLTAVQLTFSAPELPAAYTVDLPVNPGRELTARYTIPYAELPLDPFTTITYAWTVETAGGASLSVPPQTIDYVDDRFDWHSLVAPGLVAYWTDAIAESDARVALEAAVAAQATLEPILPQPIAAPLRIVIYPTTADMRSTLRLAGRDLENGLPPADLPVVMVTAVNPRTAALDLQRLIPAEITRLRFERAAGQHPETIPAWLPAGLPVLFEPAPDSGYHSDVELATWPDICSAPPTPEPAAAQSLVTYLRRTYGADALGQYIASLAAGVSCDEAVLQQFDLPATELARLWQTAAQPPALWQTALQENSLWLGLLAGSLLLMTLIFIPLSGRYPVGKEKNE